ncbi:MAG: metal-sulfur cluster assembly factor [Anaerolineae bacterium]
MVTKEDVLNALREVYDPELPLNVVDLGLIYGVEVEGGKVHVRMTMTIPGCPMHSFMTQEAHHRIASLEGVEEVNIELVWEPRWTPERMSDEAKRKLGI